MPPFRIVLLGGAGLFGRRIATALARDAGMHIVLAGRRRDAAQAVVDALVAGGAVARLDAHALDIESPGFADALVALRPDLVIHTAGPFQRRDYAVAEAALAAGAHCVDLADGRAFVDGIGALDARARAAGRWVVTGASSVPGLSAAVAAAHAPRFGTLREVHVAISPGNRTERGLATTQAILGYVGRPYRARIHGAWRTVHGWQSLRRLRIDGRTRWVARCEVPDLDVLPARYPALDTCEFRAGLELRRMHVGLWLASWAVRIGLLRDLPAWAPRLIALSNRWHRAGSDVGFMQVDMRGTGHDGAPLRCTWTLTAANGDGPQVPATAAVVLARKLARGALPDSGARACVDLFTLDECMEALRPYAVTARTEVAQMHAP